MHQAARYDVRARTDKLRRLQTLLFSRERTALERDVARGEADDLARVVREQELTIRNQRLVIQEQLRAIDRLKKERDKTKRDADHFVAEVMSVIKPKRKHDR